MEAYHTGRATIDCPKNYGSIAEKGEVDTSTWTEKAPNPPRTEKASQLPNLSNWMSQLDDDIPVSAISIPGTHDSAAFMSSWPYISTQTLDTKQQLDAGIRYFDLRCGVIKDVVEMVHGRAVLGLTLSDMLQDMYAWLDAHPSEAVLVQIKQDRKDDDSTLQFSDLITTLITSKAKYWRVNGTTPILGELRGRIQLLRRFTGKHVYHYGIDVSRWQDNPVSPFTIRTYTGVHLTIQDHYSWSTPESLPSLVAKKGGDVALLLNRATKDPEPWHWYINFSSAYEINVYYQIPPKKIAIGGYWVFRWVEGINLRLNNFLKQKVSDAERKQRFGVVVMDFPETPQTDLIKTVVESNFAPKTSAGFARTLGVILLLLLLLVLWIWYGGDGTQDIAGHWCPRLMHACSLKAVYERAPV